MKASEPARQHLIWRANTNTDRFFPCWLVHFFLSCWAHTQHLFCCLLCHRYHMVPSSWLNSSSLHCKKVLRLQFTTTYSAPPGKNRYTYIKLPGRPIHNLTDCSHNAAHNDNVTTFATWNSLFYTMLSLIVDGFLTQKQAHLKPTTVGFSQLK